MPPSQSRRWSIAALLMLSACSEPTPTAPSAEEALSAAASRTHAMRGPDWPSAPVDGAPLLVQFEELVTDDGDKRAKVRMYNFADKDIRLVELKLRYLDAAGKELKSFPWKATPSLQARSHASHVVGAFLPEETATVDTMLVRVVFDEGAPWTPEKQTP